MADGEELSGLLAAKFTDAVVSAGAFRGQHWIELKSESLVEVCTWLRDDPAADFDLLVDLTAVHWPEDSQPMELVYHLFSCKRNDRLRLKVRTGTSGPAPSLCGLWKAADWNERETYDMFGIEFEGHPDLRRILMPEEYTDFPLRKEFPLYRG